MIHPFYDRRHAGELLARRLQRYTDQPNTVIMALPRGGVPVGYEVARAIHAPLDICLVRKLGTPGQEELAMGAIASGGVRIINPAVVERLRIEPEIIDQTAAREMREMERQEHHYREGRPALAVSHQTIILVDDGLATGASMRAAAAALRQQDVQSIVVAVPVSAPEICREFHDLVDDVVCMITPPRFRAVGEWYEDFSPTTDDQVRTLLRRAAQDWQLMEMQAGQSVG